MCQLEQWKEIDIERAKRRNSNNTSHGKERECS